jgi:hypothetical protein
LQLGPSSPEMSVSSIAIWYSTHCAGVLYLYSHDRHRVGHAEQLYPASRGLGLEIELKISGLASLYRE